MSTMTYKVNIGDKLSKLIEMFEGLSGCGGFLTVNGKIIENPDDVTYSKQLIQDKAVLLLNRGEGGYGTPLKWVRFKNFVEDYFYMEVDYKDAVAFVPNTNVVFHGFGIFCNYNQKDVKYKVQICYDQEQPEEIYEVEKAYADRDQEKRTFDITLKELGLKPVKVSEGTKIHIIVWITVYESEVRRHYYGS